MNFFLKKPKKTESKSRSLNELAVELKEKDEEFEKAKCNYYREMFPQWQLFFNRYKSEVNEGRDGLKKSHFKQKKTDTDTLFPLLYSTVNNFHKIYKSPTLQQWCEENRLNTVIIREFRPTDENISFEEIEERLDGKENDKKKKVDCEKEDYITMLEKQLKSVNIKPIPRALSTTAICHLDEELPVFDPSMIQVEECWQSIIFGSTGSGKTTILKHILSVIHPTQDRFTFCLGSVGAETSYREFVDEECLNYSEDPDHPINVGELVRGVITNKAFEYTNKGKDKSLLSPHCIVLDDCQSGAEGQRSKSNLNTNSPMDMLFNNGRHYKINGYVSCQSLKGVSVDNRKNAKYIYIRSVEGLKDRQELFDNFFDGYCTRDEFRYYLQKYLPKGMNNRCTLVLDKVQGKIFQFTADPTITFDEKIKDRVTGLELASTRASLNPQEEEEEEEEEETYGRAVEDIPVPDEFVKKEEEEEEEEDEKKEMEKKECGEYHNLQHYTFEEYLDLQQYFTSETNVIQCWKFFCEKMDELGENVNDYTFIEPSAGDGAFLRVLPPKNSITLDIQPKHPDIVETNFLEWRPEDDDKKYIVFGNPPYNYPGRFGNQLALDFIKHSASIYGVEYIAMILPGGFTGPSKRKKLNGVGFYLYDYVWMKDRWFYFPNGKKRELASYFVIYSREKKTNKHDFPVPVGFQTNSVTKKPAKEYDVYVESCSYGRGLKVNPLQVYDYYDEVPVTKHNNKKEVHGIVFDYEKEHNIAVFKSIDWCNHLIYSIAQFHLRSENVEKVIMEHPHFYLRCVSNKMFTDLQQMQEDEEEEVEVRCICPNCFGEGKCLVSKARAKYLDENDLMIMEEACPFEDCNASTSSNSESESVDKAVDEELNDIVTDFQGSLNL